MGRFAVSSTSTLPNESRMVIVRQAVDPSRWTSANTDGTSTLTTHRGPASMGPSVYPTWVYTTGMPLFEYVCMECGRVDERLVRAPAPAEVRCSACGGQSSRQVPLLARSAGDCAPASSG